LNRSSVDWRAVPSRLAWVAFWILVVLSPFRASLVLVDRSGPPIQASDLQLAVTVGDIALIATLGLWAVSLLLSPRRIEFGPAFVAIPVAVLLVVAWVGVPGSVDPVLSATNAIKLTLVVGLAIYVVNELERVERLVGPIAVMIAIQALVAIGQVVEQRSVGLSWIGEQPLDPARPGISIVASADGTRWLRAYGLTDHPNILGGVLAFALLLLAAVPGRTATERTWRWLVFGLGVAALFLTFSRGAWLGYGVGLVLAIAALAWMHDRASVRRWSGAALITALVCLPLVVPLAPYLAARTNASGPIPTEARSIDERVALAQASIAIFVDRPLLGSGLGTLPIAMQAADPTFAYAYQPAHVVLIDALAETGILGGLAYLAILVGPWLALARARRRWTATLVGASAALAAVTVVGLFDYYTWSGSTGRIWAWLVLGTWVVAYHDATRGGRGV